MRKCKVEQRDISLGGVVCCFVVLTMVPSLAVSSNSQCVPQDIPNNTTLLSHMLWPNLNYHVYKLQRGRAKVNMSMLLLGVPNVSRKKKMMCQLKWLLQKKTLGTPFNLLIRRMDTHPLIIPHP